MRLDTNIIVKESTIFLSSLRNSVRLAARLTARYPRLNENLYTKYALSIEQIMISIDVFASRIENNEEQKYSFLTELYESIVELCYIIESDSVIRSSNFILEYPFGGKKDLENSKLFGEFVKVSKNQKSLSINLSLNKFKDYLKDIAISFEPVQMPLPIEDLKRIVPRQFLSPVQFYVKDNCVYEKTSPSFVKDKDVDNVTSALEYLIKDGESLVSNLENSNCDRTIVNSVKEIHNFLSSNGSIIKIGLSNIKLGELCVSFKDELSGSSSAMLISYNSSITLYASQFPEWVDFLSNAASVELNHSAIEDIYQASIRLITELDKSPHLYDPSITRTINLISGYAKSSNLLDAKRGAFALLKTMQNFTSTILEYVSDEISSFTNNVYQGVKKGAEKVAAATITISLGAHILPFLDITSKTLEKISFISSKIGDTWVIKAIDIIKRVVDGLNI